MLCVFIVQVNVIIDPVDFGRHLDVRGQAETEEFAHVLEDGRKHIYEASGQDRRMSTQLVGSLPNAPSCPIGSCYINLVLCCFLVFVAPRMGSRGFIATALPCLCVHDEMSSSSCSYLCLFINFVSEGPCRPVIAVSVLEEIGRQRFADAVCVYFLLEDSS